MKMKRYIIIIITAILASSCHDLNMAPLSDISTATFFANEDELKMFTYNFYDILPSDGINKIDAQSDNQEGSGTNQVVRGKHTEPGSGGGWNWDYLRTVNYFLKNYQRAGLEINTANHYKGMARMFRAWFYFDKVKRFGDVPWYSEPLDANDPALYKARDPRALVMDSVMNDLNFACQWIKETNDNGAANKWIAHALKARVCLHEGTFRKYHGIDGADAFLTQAYQTAKALMDSKKYKLYSTGNPYSDYGELFVLDSYNKDEILLARRYDPALHADTKGHTSNSYCLEPTQGSPGATKSLINSYLIKSTGQPFTSLPGYNTMMLKDESVDRDPRMSQTVRTPGYKRYGETAVESPFIRFGAAVTGYQLAKHIAKKSADGWQGNYNDVPVFRYAETLLIYAEAKAELGILEANDLAISIDLLRSRVAMPAMPFDVAVDPVMDAMYSNVNSTQKALVLEIRRERRIELAFEGFRYDDLMRWSCGPLLAQQFYGMYFPSKGAFDMDGDGKIDVELVDAGNVPSPPLTDRQYIELKASGPILSDGDKGFLTAQPVTVEGKDKTFDPNKHYYFPLPLDQFVLNDKLEQNPGWRKN